jgi:hypothetical protein
MREGHLRAEMRAENPDALKALSRHEPELRAALASHGIHAEQFDLALGFGDPRQGPGDHAAHNRRSSQGGVERLAAVRSAGETDALTSTSARGFSASGVDTYA